MAKHIDAPTRHISAPILCDFRGDLLTVSTSQSFPPGCRVACELPLSTEQRPLALQGKVVSVQPTDGGRFVLAVRLHSLTRLQVTALLDAVRTLGEN